MRDVRSLRSTLTYCIDSLTAYVRNFLLYFNLLFWKFDDKCAYNKREAVFFPDFSEDR